MKKFIEQIFSIFLFLFIKTEFSDSSDIVKKTAETWNIDPETIVIDPPPSETDDEKAAREKETADKLLADKEASDKLAAEKTAREEERKKKENESDEDYKARIESLDEDDPNGTFYKLSDKVELSEKQLAKIAKKTRDELGTEIFDQLPAEAQFKLIQKDVNNFVGSRNINNASQKLKTEREEIKLEREKIVNDQNKLAEDIASLEAKKKAAQEVLAKDRDDIVDMGERTELIIDQKDAKKAVEEADEKLKELQSDVASKQADIIAADIRSALKDLQSSFPELITDKDPIDVQEKYQAEINSYKDPAELTQRKLNDDEKKALRLQQVLMDFIGSGRKDLTIVQFYHIRKNQGQYPDLTLERPIKQEPKGKVIDVKTAVIGQVLADIFKAANSEPPTPAGHTSTGASTATNSRDGMGNLTTQQRAKKMGFTGAAE